MKLNLFTKSIRLGFTAATITLFSSQGMAADARLILTDKNTAIDNQYIVVFKKDTAKSKQSFNKLVSRMSAEHSINVIKQYKSSLNGALIIANDAQIEALRKEADIDFIEQDRRFTIEPVLSAQTDQPSPTWGLDRVDQRNLPLNNLYQYDQDGSSVTAYVIDTGIRNSHNDFNGRASSGWDFIDNDNDASDCNGHGTHVAGTIGGSAYGVAKNVNLVGVRVLNCSGSGTYSGVISGIDWVSTNASGPSVANMSLGGPSSAAVDAAVNAAVASGITFVVAAGNDNGANACTRSPAGAANALTVGSTTSTDQRSGFSNIGTCVNIFAPGSSITSTWHTSNSASNTISGTSMASPHVAGVAALILQQSPTATPAMVLNTLTTNGTPNVIGNVGTGSPNILLYSKLSTQPPTLPSVTQKWADFSTNDGWSSQVVGDFDDDGRDDIANFHPSNGTWWVSRSTGSNFNTTQWSDYSTNDGWTSQVVGDYNGDGKDDIANFHPSNGTWWVSLSNGTSFTTAKWADFGTNSGWTTQVAGDFNGDGKDDIANFHPSNGTWWVALSTGSGFTTVKWADFSTNSGWTTQIVGDYDGDGKDDIANFHPSNGTWWVARSTGSGFSVSKWADYSTNNGWTSQLAGDYNNDGLSDIANFHPSNGTWWVSYSLGSNFTTDKWADFSTNSGWSSQLAGDISGDGRDDVVNYHPSNGTWWLSESSGSSFATSLLSDYSTNSGWSTQVLGDFDGDGRQDIANFHPSNGTWWLTFAD